MRTSSLCHRTSTVEITHSWPLLSLVFPVTLRFLTTKSTVYSFSLADYRRVTQWVQACIILLVRHMIWNVVQQVLVLWQCGYDFALRNRLVTRLWIKITNSEVDWNPKYSNIDFRFSITKPCGNYMSQLSQQSVTLYVGFLYISHCEQRLLP
jgi:hypothetical protein